MGWSPLKFNFRPTIKLRFVVKLNFSGIKLKLHIQHINQQIHLNTTKYKK
jgi:hypothetical protein